MAKRQPRKRDIANARRRISSYIKRGFIPDEAVNLSARKLRTTTGPRNSRRMARAIVKRRATLITHLKSLGYSEIDVFNFLTEQNSRHEDIIEEYIREGSPQSFEGFNEDYFEQDIVGEKTLAEVARSENWARTDPDEQINYREWLRLRVINPGKSVIEANRSKFFRSQEEMEEEMRKQGL